MHVCLARYQLGKEVWEWCGGEEQSWTQSDWEEWRTEHILWEAQSSGYVTALVLVYSMYVCTYVCRIMYTVSVYCICILYVGSGAVVQWGFQGSTCTQENCHVSTLCACTVYSYIMIKHYEHILIVFPPSCPYLSLYRPVCMYVCVGCVFMCSYEDTIIQKANLELSCREDDIHFLKMEVQFLCWGIKKLMYAWPMTV